MDWRCKNCGCEIFNQEWISKRTFDRCLFGKEGHREWYSSYKDTDELVVECSKCGSSGKEISDIAEWGAK